MAKYTKSQFLIDVAKEAKAIKKHATEREIARLDFSSLEPDQPENCIYGQMTGNCKSSRACRLIFNCCQRYICNTYEGKIKENGFADIKGNVNGEKIDGIDTPRKLKREREVSLDHFSALEAYILLPNAKNKNLIAFLKGERKDLVL